MTPSFSADRAARAQSSVADVDAAHRLQAACSGRSSTQSHAFVIDRWLTTTSVRRESGHGVRRSVLARCLAAHAYLTAQPAASRSVTQRHAACVSMCVLVTSRRYRGQRVRYVPSLAVRQWNDCAPASRGSTTSFNRAKSATSTSGHGATPRDLSGCATRWPRAPPQQGGYRVYVTRRCPPNCAAPPEGGLQVWQRVHPLHGATTLSRRSARTPGRAGCTTRRASSTGSSVGAPSPSATAASCAAPTRASPSLRCA